jgi:hypothetical protein
MLSGRASREDARARCGQCGFPAIVGAHCPQSEENGPVADTGLIALPCTGDSSRCRSAGLAPSGSARSKRCHRGPASNGRPVKLTSSPRLGCATIQPLLISLERSCSVAEAVRGDDFGRPGLVTSACDCARSTRGGRWVRIPSRATHFAPPEPSHARAHYCDCVVTGVCLDF